MSFTDTEFSDEIQTSPFRVSGLVSLFFGVISAGTLATTMLLVLPVLGIFFGFLALRPVRGTGGKPGGRMLAVIGITLSLMFGCWSYGYFSVREHYLGQTARVFAENWLLTVRHGQPELAYELTKPASARQLENMSLAMYYAPENEKEYEQYDMFATRPLIREIMTAETEPDWVFDRIVTIYTSLESDFVVVKFRDATGTLGTTQVTLCRSTDTSPAAIESGGNANSWAVTNFDLTSEAEGSAFDG